MKIQFTHDFQGKLTGPYFYPAGTVADLEDDIAQQLIAQSHAVAVSAPVPVPVPVPDLPTPEEKAVKRGKPA